jgi:hypothetical protein
MSQSKNVNKAARLGYAKMGKIMDICRRKMRARARTASNIPDIMQTSQDGNKEPAISKTGARAHPENNRVARTRA